MYVLLDQHNINLCYVSVYIKLFLVLFLVRQIFCTSTYLLFCVIFHLGFNTDESPAEQVVNVMSELRGLQEILAKFKSLQVDPTEFACLKGIVLFKTGMTKLNYISFFL